MSLRYINNKDNVSYLNDMRGWYLEIYKDEKYLCSSIIVVYLNDKYEKDCGKLVVSNFLLSKLKISLTNCFVTQVPTLNTSSH